MEVGAQLLIRSARGIRSHGRGPRFLDHARPGTRPGRSGARRRAPGSATQQARLSGLGFSDRSGNGLVARSRVRILHDELPQPGGDDLQASTPLPSPDALSKGRIDLAFMRPEVGVPDLAFRVATRDAAGCGLYRAIIGSPHTTRSTCMTVVGETFISVSAHRAYLASRHR